MWGFVVLGSEVRHAGVLDFPRSDASTRRHGCLDGVSPNWGNASRLGRAVASVGVLIVRSFTHHVVFSVAIILSAFLILDRIEEKSPTEDEWAHLVRGLQIWHGDDFRLQYAHPPLANAITAAPLARDKDVPDFCSPALPPPSHAPRRTPPSRLFPTSFRLNALPERRLGPFSFRVLESLAANKEPTDPVVVAEHFLGSS